MCAVLCMLPPTSMLMLGIVMNRFSRDLGFVDLVLPLYIQDVVMASIYFIHLFRTARDHLPVLLTLLRRYIACVILLPVWFYGTKSTSCHMLGSAMVTDSSNYNECHIICPLSILSKGVQRVETVGSLRWIAHRSCRKTCTESRELNWIFHHFHHFQQEAPYILTCQKLWMGSRASEF